jgi:hypothetical protein
MWASRRGLELGGLNASATSRLNALNTGTAFDMGGIEMGLRSYNPYASGALGAQLSGQYAGTAPPLMPTQFQTSTTGGSTQHNNQFNQQQSQYVQPFWQQYLLAGVGAAGAVGAGMAAGCWIAEAVYGADDSRVPVIRWYLNFVWGNTAFGSVVMALYRKYGQRIAPVVKRSRVLKALFRPLFDLAWRSAVVHLASHNVEATCSQGP